MHFQGTSEGEPAGPLLLLWQHHLTTIDLFIDQYSQLISPPYTLVGHLDLLLREKPLSKITL